ncbi:hypothetical protein C0J52_25057 [Blattella germanica]|nr:hypothetical protein C0J52_25057 [Blattella germanica]
MKERTCFKGKGTFDPDLKVCTAEPCTGPSKSEIGKNLTPSFKCPSIGLFPDSTDKHKFYVCSSSLEAIPGSCMKGKGIFDPLNRICIFAVGCKSEFTCVGAGIFQDPTDCHNFYVCDSNLQATAGTCMGGNGSFDAISKVCRVTPCSGAPVTVTPPVTSNFTCTAVGLFADPNDCHNFYSCDQYLQAIPGSCIRGTGSFDPINKVCSTAACTTTTVPATDNFVCVSSGYFPDSNDCHAFYSCNNQLVAIHSTCTSNGYFDQDTRNCVIGTCSQSTTLSPVTPTTSGTTSATSAPFVCVSTGFFADPSNCRGYYACDNALNPYHGICLGGGGYFDEVSRGCVVGTIWLLLLILIVIPITSPIVCEFKIIDATDRFTKEEHHINAKAHYETFATSNDLPYILWIQIVSSQSNSKVPFTCPKAGVYEDPDDCHNFYVCDDDLTAIPGACLMGSFDPATKVCISSLCTQKKPTTFVCPHSGIFQDPLDCHKFYYCDRDLKYFHQTCTEYGHFHPKQICMPGPCPSALPELPVDSIDSSDFRCTEVGEFPDPTNCHNYIKCDENLVARRQTCFNGTGSYDSASKSCRALYCADPIPTFQTNSIFRCPSVGLFEDPDDCRNFYSCFDNLTPILARCLDGSFDVVKRSCVSKPCASKEDFDFKCTRPGYFPDTTDCHKFFSCDKELNIFHETCTANGHYDPVQICKAGPCPSEMPSKRGKSGTSHGKTKPHRKWYQFFSSGQAPLCPSYIIIQVTTIALLHLLCF